MRGENFKKLMKQKAPTILTCVGAVGVVTTSIFTAKATVKAVDILKEAEKEKGDTLTTKETIKLALPIYIPAAISGIATISCIFGANILNKKYQASLISAYGVLDQNFKEYKGKVKELYGEDSDEKVQESFANDNNPRQTSKRG